MLSRRAQQVNPSPTLRLTAQARELIRNGVDVLAFTAGEPDFDTPDFAKAAALEAIHAGYTKYTPTTGIPELKEAICEKFWRDNRLRYTPDQIVVSCGAKHSIFNALMVLCDPGDEVLIPIPCWVTYPEQVLLVGAVPVYVPTYEKDGFLPSLEAIRDRITHRTKAMILNSPNNPTGAVFSRKTLKAIASLALQWGFYLIADEIYEKLVYEGAVHESLASLGEEVAKQTITVNGVSKSYAMTGWRIGYAGAPLEIAQAMGCLQDQMTSNPTSIAQYAALGALRAPQEWYEKIRALFEERRWVMIEGLNRLPGVRCWTPQGAFYAFANVEAWLGAEAHGQPIRSTEQLAEYLLQEAKVAVVPGEGFMSPGYLRLSYATSVEVIQRGLERIGNALARLKV